MRTETGTDTDRAVKLLKADSLVAIPTETVYGLAGNALSAVAVEKIYAAKNRPRFNPLILHVHTLEKAAAYAHFHPVEHRLAEVFMPGSLTLLLDKKPAVPDLITAGSAQVAIRIPAHPLTLDLLQRLPFPLAAPSANPSGYISPSTAAHVLDGLNGKIPYILDGGPARAGLESTIVRWNEAEHHFIIYRKGTITAEDISHATGGLPVIFVPPGTSITTAGQLKSHYAPDKPLLMGRFAELAASLPLTLRAGVITLIPATLPERFVCFPLSKEGNLAEAASRLFAVLRQVDADADIDIIIAEPVPDTGIGMAINDRLQRARHSMKEL